MRAPLLATLAAASIGTAGLAQAGPFAPPVDWPLAWADEFDREGLPDPAHWQFDTAMNPQGWHNHELQYYAGPDGGNAVVQGGQLRITARRQARRDAPDWGGQGYASARLISRGLAQWTYGFFEVRAQLPCGRGTWPAIWMLGASGGWPGGGELDLMEHLGRDPGQVFSTVHMQAGHGARGVGASIAVPEACSGFHRYQMQWTRDDIVFGVDGQQTLRYPRLDGGAATWPFDGPQFMILNLAVGGDLGGPVDDSALPATMAVDYVRVWQPAPVPAPPASAGH